MFEFWQVVFVYFNSDIAPDVIEYSRSKRKMQEHAERYNKNRSEEQRSKGQYMVRRYDRRT